MAAHARVVPPGSALGAVTHDTEAARSWMDILVAHDDWVRREFDELVEAGWGGSRPNRPPTRQGAHGPRRAGPRSRPTRVRGPRESRAPVPWRTPSRGPPGQDPSEGSARGR